jgi:hypothetical protein
MSAPPLSDGSAGYTTGAARIHKADRRAEPADMDRISEEALDG